MEAWPQYPIVLITKTNVHKMSMYAHTCRCSEWVQQSTLGKLPLFTIFQISFQPTWYPCTAAFHWNLETWTLLGCPISVIILYFIVDSWNKPVNLYLTMYLCCNFYWDHSVGVVCLYAHIIFSFEARSEHVIVFYLHRFPKTWFSRRGRGLLPEEQHNYRRHVTYVHG